MLHGSVHAVSWQLMREYENVEGYLKFDVHTVARGGLLYVVRFQHAKASAHVATISAETKTSKKHNDGVVFVVAFAQHMFVSIFSLFGVHNTFTHKTT